MALVIKVDSVFGLYTLNTPAPPVCIVITYPVIGSPLATGVLQDKLNDVCPTLLVVGAGETCEGAAARANKKLESEQKNV